MASMSSSSELLNEENIEIQALQKSFVKTTKKSNYGSLRKDIPSQAIVPIVNFKHRIKPGETLQGISLKYNVPIENIKRSNRLWSNDLAFVKDFLIVPIRKDKLDELNLKDENVEDETKSSTSSKNENGAADNTNNNLDLAGYLNKFDNLIIESKMKLKSLESSSNMGQKSNYDQKRKAYSNGVTYSEVTETDPDDLFQTSKISSNLKKSSTLHLDSSSSPNSKHDNSLTSTPDCLIADPVSNDTSASSSNSSYLNGSRAKLAHKNLLRLEREKDELFEL